MRTARKTLFTLASTLLLAVPATGQGTEVKDLSQCVRMLQKGPAAAREAAVAAAARFGADAVPAIGALLAIEGAVDVDASFRRSSARRALWRVATQATAPDASDRPAVSLALVQLLGKLPPRDAFATATVLELLGVVANDTASIRQIAQQLDSTELAEPALLALRRIPGEVVEQVLQQRLQQPGPLGRVQILRALVERDSPRLVRPMLDMLVDAPEVEAVELRAALARSGDAQAEATLHSAMAQAVPGALDAWLVFLQANTPAPGASEHVLARYRELLASARPDVRAAAVRGLATVAAATDCRRVVAALGDADPAVQAAAREALAAWPGIDDMLLAAHRDAKAAVRGGMLQVLAARQPAQAQLLARNDAGDSDAAVRRAALSLLADAGEASSADLLFTAAGDADAGVRAIAARGLSQVAAARQRAGDRAGALNVLHRILTAGGDADLMRDAIAQVGRIGSPTSLPVLQPLQTDARYGEAVAEASMQIATAMPAADKAQAIAILQQVFEQSKDRGRRHSALRQLQQRGVDVVALVRRSGVVQDWHVLGPWPKAGSKGDLGVQPFGAGMPDLAATVRQGDKELRWQGRHTEDPDGVIDLAFLNPHENVSAFAVHRFDWPADADLVLKLGSDDGAAVWVNGELVHSNFVPRGLAVDDDTMKVHFVKGANTVLVRVDQGGGDFALCVRICDAGGKPVDWSRN